MNTQSLQLSIVIPTFNEVANVQEVVRRVEAAMGATAWEIIFVDDDSPDGTANQVRELACRDPRVRCLQRVGRRGLSTACIEGMMAASGPILAVMDADLQHDESILPDMLDKLRHGCDVVIGTRYAQGGGTGDWDEKRKQMSLLATRVSHLVLKQPVSDPMSGFFMLDRRVLDECVRGLSGMGFKILLDLLATSQRKLRIGEVPYQFRTRIHGESKLDHMVMWEYGMLLADKLIGRWIPVRFLAFSIIGGVGVFVHMLILTLALKAMGMDFSHAQTGATVITMVFNFALNNSVTYRDQRLKGGAWFRGLLSFMLACSIGAIANIGIATYLFEHRTAWLPAALAGILVGAVWNYAITKIYTWGKK
ncbi:MAG: glycosyltransferase family 2 protein [Hydrogenophaga sp.]|nr:glycosyltransferase family 2 protein [Hydrogenophaga sp.]